MSACDTRVNAPVRGDMFRRIGARPPRLVPLGVVLAVVALLLSPLPSARAGGAPPIPSLRTPSEAPSSPSPAAPAPSPTPAGGGWENLHLTGFSPRGFASVAYDPVNRVAVAFGGEGQGGVAYGETWVYSVGRWTPVVPADAVSPTPRYGAGFAFDPSTNTTVLFGGYTNYGRPSGSGYLLNDTWEYSNGTWTNVSSTAGVAPRARWDAAMVTDGTDDGVVLFGGRTDNGTALSPGTAISDTWRFRHGAWDKLLASGHASSPSPRYGAASTEGPTGAVFLYSGTGGTTDGSADDLWSFDGSSWHLVPTPSTQAGVLQDATLLEADSGALLLVGGCAPNLLGPTCVPSSTWYDLESGGFRPDSGKAPSARWAAAGAYDPAANESLLFGGINGSGGAGLMAQAWQYSNASGWSPSNVSASGPPALAGGATTFDPTLGGVLLFGGGYALYSGFYPGRTPVPATASDQTWSYSAGVWTDLSDPSAPAPSPRWDAGLAYDARGGYDVLFGGIGPGCGSACVLNDTWLFQNGSWRLAPGTGGAHASPPQLELFSMAYDAQLGCVVLFGGSGSNETWLYCDGSWSDATPSLGASPPRREAAMMAYDEVSGTLYLFGGYYVSSTGASTQYRDLWALANGSWEPLDAVATGPAPVAGATFVDTDRGYLLLFGGIGHPTTAPALSNATWEFNGSGWTNLSASIGPAPAPRYEANGADDPLGSYVLVVSGCTNRDCTGGPSETWAADPLPSMSALASVDRPMADLGQPVVFTAVRAGGSGNTSNLVYSGLPPGCASIPSPELRCTPAEVGWSNVSVTIVDAAGLRVTSPPTAFQVIVPLRATVAASSTAVDVGQAFSIMAGHTGGLAPVSLEYEGLPPGCRSADAPVIYCSPVASGTFPIVVAATDAAGFTNTSAPAVVRVGGPFSVALTADPLILDEQATLLVQATPLGGVAPYSYRWEGLPAGCSGADAPTISCTPESTGTYLVSVLAADGASESSYQALPLTVNLPLFGRLTATSPSSCDGPYVAHFDAAIQGGTPDLTYNWTLGDGAFSTEGPSLEHSYAAPGAYHVTLVVNDSTDGQAVLSTDVSAVRACPSGGGGSSFAPIPGTIAPFVAIALVVAAGAAGVVWLSIRGRSRRRRSKGRGRSVREGP